MKFETLAVHAGGERDPATGSVAPPIHLSTTYEHGPAGERPHGWMYIREGNPTQVRLEEALTAVEGGAAALVFASGMAAGTAYLQALPAGTHVLFQEDLYYGFRTLARDLLPRWGLAASFADFRDLEALRGALRPETGLLWTESPSNPLMQIVDLAAVAELARGAGARLLVDGTFATPALQRPLALGAAAVLHSATKYLGGHGDVQAGALVFAAADDLVERAAHLRHITGGVASPFNSWLVLRGLRSLACRIERHSANALAVAQVLAGHDNIEAVHYPGLPVPPRPRGRPPPDARLRRHALAAGARRPRADDRGRLAPAALRQRHQPRRHREPDRAPCLQRGAGEPDARKPPPRLDRPRASGRPRGRPPASARMNRR